MTIKSKFRRLLTRVATGALGLSIAAQSAHAGDPCCDTNACDSCSTSNSGLQFFKGGRLFGNSGCDSACDTGCECPSWKMSGFLNGGYMLNNDSDRFNGPYNQIDRHGLMFNQGYLVLEKDVTKSSQSTVGGRIDTLFGHDHFLAQSTGFERNRNGTQKWNGEEYGLAFPQAYASVGNSLMSVKAGHFYTIIGYEGVPATSNFFYTKSNSYMFAGPFTHWGAIGTAQLTDSISVDSGLVNGWDALDRLSNKVATINRVNFGAASDPTKLSFSVINGDEANHDGTAMTSRTRYSLIASQQLSCRTQYVFHHWLGHQADATATGADTDWFGIDQYLFYKINSKVTSAIRAEWFRDDDGARIGLNRPSNPNKPPFVGDLYSISSGLNYRANSSLLIRPELRYDWYKGTGAPFNGGVDQFTTGADLILTF